MLVRVFTSIPRQALYFYVHSLVGGERQNHLLSGKAESSQKKFEVNGNG